MRGKGQELGNSGPRTLHCSIMTLSTPILILVLWLGFPEHAPIQNKTLNVVVLTDHCPRGPETPSVSAQTLGLSPRPHRPTCGGALTLTAWRRGPGRGSWLLFPRGWTPASVSSRLAPAQRHRHAPERSVAPFSQFGPCTRSQVHIEASPVGVLRPRAPRRGSDI